MARAQRAGLRLPTAFACAWLVAGCGARTEPTAAADGGTDVAVVDVGARDAFHDATPRDVPSADVPPDAFAGPDGGDACESDEDCPGACVRDPLGTVEDLSAVPLVCGRDEAARTDGLPCQESSGCGRGLCLVSDRCAAPCGDDADCPERSRCADVFVRSSDEALQSGRACVPRIARGEGWRAERITSGRVLSPGLRVEYEGRSPGETLLWVFEGYDASDVGGVRSGPQVLWDALGPFDGSLVNPVARVDEITTVLLPNSSRSPSAGSYEVEFRPMRPGPRGTEYRIVGPSGGETLDVDVFYFPASLTVQGDRRVSPRLQALFDRAWALLEASFGIRVGRVEHHPVVGRLAARLTVSPLVGRIHPNLGEAGGLSAGLGSPSLVIYWMRDIELVLGIAGNIPGPWGLHGTTQSGVGLSIDALVAAGERYFETTLVHEIAHYLGLFHTTEADGRVFEPIEDTESCLLSADLNGDAVLSPDECGSSANNIMFWAESGSDQTTAQQREIARNALLVR